MWSSPSLAVDLRLRETEGSVQRQPVEGRGRRGPGYRWGHMLPRLQVLPFPLTLPSEGQHGPQTEAGGRRTAIPAPCLHCHTPILSLPVLLLRRRHRWLQNFHSIKMLEVRVTDEITYTKIEFVRRLPAGMATHVLSSNSSRGLVVFAGGLC